MRISLNWLKKFVDIKVSDEELVRLIGARLVEVEGVIDEAHKYDNIFVVKVVECEPIPETHLHLCQINDGKEDIQVVCGAPNVHAGMLAAWIAPGAIVPQSVHEDAPFVIGTRKMLGKYESHGMLAGADELDFGDDHSGIVEIDPDMAKPGDKLADVFELNDLILDIENKSLTHRPDCFGMVGFAREVAGILGQKFNEDNAHFKNTVPVDLDETAKVEVEIEDQNLCPSYVARVMSIRGELKKSKYLSWQDTILAKSGMRPIDPIVDATNYLMLLSGQPLHAFDYDKFVAVGKNSDPKIIVRSAKKGEKLVLLDESEVELNENDIVITSNNVPVALAGAMGGKNTAIDENTKRIILESATFSLYNLRKTQMSHGIFSEAITRFTKGQPASQTALNSADFAVLMASSLKTIYLADKATPKSTPNVVKITTSEINNLLGTAFTGEEIKTTLENVGFKIERSEDLSREPYEAREESEPRNDGRERTGLKNVQFEVTVPSWRTDIAIKEDIIEEIGRLTGYDNIVPVLPKHATSSKNQMVSLKKQIREILSSKNANELLTYTFVHGDLMKKVNQDPKNSYKIVNSISPDLQYIRQTIIPSLLVKSYDNLKLKHEKFALFEMNQVYSRAAGLDGDGVPIPAWHLGFVATSSDNKSNFYLAKKYLETTMKHLGFTVAIRPFAKNLEANYFEPKRSADVYLGDEKIGQLGEIKTSIARNLKLPAGTAGFEIELEPLLNGTPNLEKHAEINEFPFVSRDITITTDKNYADIFSKLEDALESKTLIHKIIPTSIYQPEGEDKKLSFHLEFANRHKTLESAEILEIMQELEKIS